MMKIGILTFHRAENYGAQFQSYALYRYLLEKGVEVEFVDYWPTYHSAFFYLFSFSVNGKAGILKRIAKFVALCIAYFWRKERKLVFRTFMEDYLGLNKTSKFSDSNLVIGEYDLVLYGSDQIWRKQGLPGCDGFDDVYFGSKIVKTKKRIAFAASMGGTDVDESDKEYLVEALSRFERMYVRENSLQQLIQSLGFEVSLVLDPVFLLSQAQWRDLLCTKEDISEPYIFYYNLLESRESDLIVRQLQNKTNLRVVEITKTLNPLKVGARYKKDIGPQQFLSYLANATYVISNSFHGVALSIIFEKQFYACGMGKRSGRVESLLSLFGIEDRLLGEVQLPFSIEYIDYKTICNRIDEQTKMAQGFLSREIGYSNYYTTK